MNRALLKRENDPWPAGLHLRTALKPGDLGRLIELHGKTYDELAGFGLAFEAYVAKTVAEFGLQDRFQGKIWMLERDQNLLGSCAIVYRDARQAQLRWVLLATHLHGLGLGRRLVELAIEHCRDQNCKEIVLFTTDGLEASSQLYQRLGFKVVSDHPEPLWDGPRALIQMKKDLSTTD